MDPGPDMTIFDDPGSVRGAPDWRAVKGEPDWMFDCYKASPWPRFVRRMFDLHKLRPEDQRFPEAKTPIAREGAEVTFRFNVIPTIPQSAASKEKSYDRDQSSFP